MSENLLDIKLQMTEEQALTYLGRDEGSSEYWDLFHSVFDAVRDALPDRDDHPAEGTRFRWPKYHGVDIYTVVLASGGSVVGVGKAIDEETQRLAASSLTVPLDEWLSRSSIVDD